MAVARAEDVQSQYPELRKKKEAEDAFAKELADSLNCKEKD